MPGLSRAAAPHDGKALTRARTRQYPRTTSWKTPAPHHGRALTRARIRNREPVLQATSSSERWPVSSPLAQSDSRPASSSVQRRARHQHASDGGTSKSRSVARVPPSVGVALLAERAPNELRPLDALRFRSMRVLPGQPSTPKPLHLASGVSVVHRDGRRKFADVVSADVACARTLPLGSFLSERSKGMAKKTVLVSDQSGQEIEEGKGAKVRIIFNDARRGVRELDLTDAEAERLGGRPVARRGRRPKSAG
jgi:hypothetical protein